jgi:DNA-binding SARP family transcriptional activator
VDARRVPTVWYQVDGGDADVATFFHYLALALPRRPSRAAWSVPVLTPEHWLALSLFARRYFQGFFARLRPPFILVLDNYHVVPPHSPFHEVVGEGLGELPAGGAAIVASRSEPPASLARLRAGGAVDIVGWDALRLTLDETRRLARHQRARPLGTAALRTLHDRTEGWAAGVVLLLERTRRDEAGSSSPDGQPPESVFDYFAGEMLGKADPRTRRFLLETAFLPSMSARMAGALTGRPEADRILADLARRHFFTERRAGPEAVFEYHALFRLFLLRQARETLPPPALAAVQRRAAALLAGVGRIEDAVALLRAAGDWDGLAQAITGAAPALLAQGRRLTLEEWMAGLPAEVLEGSGWLQYWLGTARLPFGPGGARPHLERAFARFREAGDPAGLFSAWSGVIGSILYEWDDFARLDPWLTVVEGLLRDHPTCHSVELEARVASNVFAARMFRRPGQPETAAWAERARLLSRNIRDVDRRMLIGFMLTTYHCWMGDLARAGLVLETLRELARSPAASALVRVTGHLAEAYHGWQAGTPGETLRAVAAGLETAEATGVHLWDSELYAQGACAALTAGDGPAAEGFLRKKAAVMDPARRLDVSHYHFLSGWAAMLRGDLPRARECVEQTLAVESGVPFPQALNELAMAQVLQAGGDSERAARHLAAARRIAGEINSRLLDFMLGIVEAHVAFATDDAATGTAALQRALALGREHGYLTCAWWRPDVMASLAVRALEAGIEVDYVRVLVRRRGLLPAEPPLELERWPWPLQVYTLGAFRLARDGAPVEFVGKVQKMPIALLEALVALGGRGVPETELAEALWPEADGDAAHQALATTLHRLRQLLGHEKAITLRDGRLGVDPRYCWVDAWAFERLLDRADAGVRRDRPAGALALAERALALYRGPFLAGERDEPWVIPFRERLRRRFLRQIATLGHTWEAAGEWRRAVDCYERGLEIDDLAEEFYQGLMTCYLRLGRRADGLAVYRRCHATLLATLGVAPSPETERLRAALRATP